MCLGCAVAEEAYKSNANEKQIDYLTNDSYNQNY